MLKVGEDLRDHNRSKLISHLAEQDKTVNKLLDIVKAKNEVIDATF